MSCLETFPSGGIAVVIGSRSAIGRAMVAALAQSERFDAVLSFGRDTAPVLDVTCEDNWKNVAAQITAAGKPLRLVLVTTGLLRGPLGGPERTWGDIDPMAMAGAFAVNAIGPALALKHLLPLLPKEGKSMFAALSARVGSIADNRLGGWFSYRASKAALNQILHTAAIELARSRRAAVCVALHPGTVDTPLSAPFARHGLDLHTPYAAAAHLVAVMDRLRVADSGGFFDWRGAPIPW
ncbi:MAG: SDR family oxidoreductase [Alphaproteobacteria bacterium]|nr:SDR family oxidoreductase [Alphaproteobacteria bacterium]